MSAAARAFDRAAPTYDRDFTERQLGRWLRARVWEAIAPYARPGVRVLELGCGTGEDARWLARRGCHVTATDASPAMLAAARDKATAAGVAEQLAFELLDLNALPSSPFPAPSSSLVLANFGVLNCVRERAVLAAWLAPQLPVGGTVVLVVMGPLCPWEIGWHLLHGAWRVALRRFRSGIEAHAGGGGTVRVWYPAPSTVRREFAPHFRHRRTVAIGALLPPSYLAHLVERWPRAFEVAARLERVVGAYFPWNWLNDHYLMVLERR